jgi:hypothetical protein
MTEQMRERVELAGARSVRAVLKMGSGTLVVKGGAEALLEGTFEFSDPAWQPEVSYEVLDGVGSLVVEHPRNHPSVTLGRPLGRPSYHWDLALGNEVPLELKIQLGSGDADLRLDDTHVFMLQTQIGSGNVRADLSGATALRHVAMKVGSGRVDLNLEGEYAHLARIEVAVASGISDLVLNGDYPALKELRMHSASGRIGVVIGGRCPALKALVINTASGMVDLALSGSLPEDVEVGIHCVSGLATVKVPPALGMAVRFSALSGKFKAPGFHKESGHYVNAAFHEGADKLHLAMSTVSGELLLQPTGA